MKYLFLALCLVLVNCGEEKRNKCAELSCPVSPVQSSVSEAQRASDFTSLTNVAQEEIVQSVLRQAVDRAKLGARGWNGMVYGSGTLCNDLQKEFTSRGFKTNESQCTDELCCYLVLMW